MLLYLPDCFLFKVAISMPSSQTPCSLKIAYKHLSFFESYISLSYFFKVWKLKLILWYYNFQTNCYRTTLNFLSLKTSVPELPNSKIFKNPSYLVSKRISHTKLKAEFHKLICTKFFFLVFFKFLKNFAHQLVRSINLSISLFKKINIKKLRILRILMWMAWKPDFMGYGKVLLRQNVTSLRHKVTKLRQIVTRLQQNVTKLRHKVTNLRQIVTTLRHDVTLYVFKKHYLRHRVTTPRHNVTTFLLFLSNLRQKVTKTRHCYSILESNRLKFRKSFICKMLFDVTFCRNFYARSVIVTFCRKEFVVVVTFCRNKTTDIVTLCRKLFDFVTFCRIQLLLPKSYCPPLFPRILHHVVSKGLNDE